MKYSDYMKKKKEEEGKKKESQVSISNNLGYAQYKVAQKFGIDTLGTDISSMGKTIEGVYSGWQSEESMKNTLSSVQSLYDRLGKYQEYQKQYGGADLSELQSSYKELIDNWDSLASKYKSYKNADAYNKERNTLNELYSMPSKDIESKMNVDDIYNTAKEYDKKVMDIAKQAMNIRNPSAIKTFKSTLDKATKERDDYLKSVGYSSMDDIEKAKSGVAYTTADGYNIKWQDLYNEARLGEYTQELKGKVDIEKTGTYKKKPVTYDRAYGSAYSVVSDEDAHIYNLINGDEDALNYENTYNVHMTNTNDDLKYNYLTPEEKKAFNSIEKTEGIKKALEYVDMLSPELRERRIADQKDFYSNLAIESPIGSSVASVVANVGNNMMALPMMAMDYAEDGSIDPNSSLYTNRRNVTTTRSTVEDMIDSGTGQFFYRHGMNLADNLAARIMSLGTGNGALSQFLMSSGAVVDTTLDAKERGLSDEQALGLGAVAGATEWYFESKGFEALIDKKTLSESAWKYFVNDIKTELIGELATEGTNDIADYLIGQDLSKLNTEFRGYLVSGLSEKEALTKVVKETLLRYADVAAGTIFSSGVMAGGPAVIGGYQQNRYNKALGQDIKANERVSDVFALADNPEIASAYEAYTRYAKKGITADNVSDVKLGRLANMVKSDNVEILNSKKSTSEQKTEALKRLAEFSLLGTENTVAKEKKKLNVGEETVVAESGETVDIKNLRAKGKDIFVATENGEISVEDMTFTDKDADLVSMARIIAREDGADVANLFINQYDGETDVDAYANQFNLTMAYAKNNYSFNEILNKKGNLSAEQVNAIYQETRIKADKEKAKYIKKLNKKMADKGFYKGIIDESVIDYNNTSAEGKVNWNSLTGRQREAVTFIKGFAQATGMNLTFVANNPKYNGKYDRETNTITINLDKGGFDAINNIHETIIPTMSHETTHWMKEKSPELWRNLNEIVFSTLTEHYNSNTEQAIKDKVALLDMLEPHMKHTEEDAKGRSITEEDLIRAEMNRKGKSEDVSREEIIARACEDMLKMSEQGRKIFFSLSEEEQKTLVGKIKSLINDLLNWANELLNSYEATSTEARIMREYKEQLQKASKVWDEMLKQSVEANQSLEKSGAVEHKKSTSEGDALFLFKESTSGDSKFIIDAIKRNVDSISAEKKFSVVSEEIDKSIRKSDYVYNIFKSQGEMAFNPTLGEVELSYAGAKKTVFHGFGGAKLTASKAVKDVIEYGDIIEETNNYENKGLDRYVIAARGEIDTKDSIVGVIVNSYPNNKNSKAKFYLHEAIIIETDSPFMTAPQLSVDAMSESVPKVSVLNSDKNVKGKISDKTIDAYEKAQEMQIEINQLTEQIRNLEKGDDFGAIMDALTKSIDNNDTENGIALYNKWLKESGYKELREKRDALQNELNQLRKDLQESSKQKALDEEQKAIEKSGLSEADYFRKQAVKEFGYTPYFYDAGYITPNGKMLNFSGEKGAHYGSRGQDHRAIGIVYANVEGSKAMVKFMGEGNIRIMAESPGLDISSSAEPTTEQYATIRKFVREYANKEYFNIDLTDAEGHTIGNYEYEGKISAERVVNDIKYFFENGTTREKSSISQFLYSDKNADLETQINTSMTMDEAKQMIQRAFVIGGIYEWYDREYKNGDEWLRGEGASEVALNIENEYTLTEKYLNKLQGYIDGDFYVEDILEAYLKGTLVGQEKPKAKRLDISKEYRINDERFYSPQRIKDAKKLLSVATQRITEKNRKEVSDARAKVLIFAHNKGASELLGMTQAELNKKLRAWSNYSAKARDISKRFNNGVADSNKWTGIENCSWLYKGTVTTKDIESLVKSVKGASSDYEKLYIARTMLALDTHIDWSWLSFEFDTYNEVNKGKTFSVSKCLGYYTNESRKIVVTHDKPHTVAHEMGHALDYQWARDLGYSSTALTEVSRHTEKITDAETKQFFENFRIFIDSLTDNGDIRSEYSQNPKEVFARFVARFVQWVDNTATGNHNYNHEVLSYNDKFTASNYIEFVKLLQEKAMLDAKKMETNSLEEVRFSEKDSKGNALSEGQIEYFKDSTVRDNKGRLIPVYHGTTSNFNIFRKGDVGYHFGTKGAARGRVGYGKNVIIKECYLNITNPIVFDKDLGSWDADHRLTRELYERGILSVEEAEHILFTDDKLYKRSTERANELLVKVLKSKGYDGIKYQNTFETKNATTSYIAFSPEQIKLTSNTNPTSNPDIRFSLKDEINSLPAEDKEIVLEVRNRAIYSRSIATMSEDRLSKAYDDYSFRTSPSTTSGYLAYIEPYDFIYLTTTNTERFLENNPHRLNEGVSEQWGNENNIQKSGPLYLRINEEGKVVGHEGRHRMAGLLRENVDRVAVIIETGRVDNAKPISIKKFLGQDFGETKSYKSVYVHDMIPISKEYENINRHIFGDVTERSPFMETNIRYSEKEQGVYDFIGETERIENENAKLNVDAGKLKSILGTEEIANRKFLNIANYLKKISGSSMDSAILGKMIKTAYTSMQSSDALTWESIDAQTRKIAESVMTNDMGVSSDYFKRVMFEIRKDKISLSEEQRARMEERFGNYGNFHKYVFGRVNVTKDGVPLEKAWGTWAKKYPSLFDANVSGAEQIDALVEAVDALKATSSIMGEYEHQEAIRHLSTEIYNQFWNIATDSSTVENAESYRKEHKAMMEELRKDYENRQKDLVAHPVGETTLKYESLLRKVKETKRKEIARAKEHGREMLAGYKENAERKSKIQSITSNALSLNEYLLKNSKDKHIPEIMREPVTALLQAIDFSSKRLLEGGEATQKDISLSKALGKVKDMMVKATNAHEELVELYGHGLDEDIEKMVDSVDNIMRTVGDNEFVINRMSLADLQTLDKMVKTIRHAVNKLNSFHTVNHAKGLVHLSQESMTYLNSLGKGKIHDGLRGKAEKLLNWNNALPYYAFKRFGSGGIKVYEALQDGWDKFAFNTKQILDYANEAYTSKEVKEWSEDVRTFKILIPADEDTMASADYVPQYQEVQFTIPQIMSMYCLYKREQARGHLFKGGVRVADFKDAKGNIVSQSEGIIFTEKDISTIFGALTGRQKAVADRLQEFMNTVTTDWGNEVSMARFGYKAFGEENYFPIQSDDNNLAVNDATEQANSLFRLLNMSFTKSTVEKANNRIVISDIFDVFAQHTSDMAKYNALALPVLDAFKWYNYTEKQDIAEGTFKTKSVKQSIENAFGRDGKSYFTTFLKDINGQKEVSRDTLGKGFFTNAKIAAVGMNLRVVALQPTSYVRASAVIDNKYLTQALGHKPKIEKAEQYCGIALWKSMGYYDTNIQRGLEAQIKHADTWKDKAVEFSMKGAEWADKLTWGYLWNACELEIRDTRRDLKVGSKEFYDAIAKRLREVIYATQVVDSTMTRSQMMRSSDGYDKMLTSFASEPTLSYNMLQDAYMEFSLDARRTSKKEAWKKHRGRMGRILYAYTMTNAVAALVESAFDAFREDDDEEMDMIAFMKLYFKNFALDMSIGNKIPFVKELYSVLQGFSSSRLDTQWAQYLYSALNAKKPSKRFSSYIRLISQLSGLPFYNVYRDAMAALNKLDLFTEEDLNEMFGDVED